MFLVVYPFFHSKPVKLYSSAVINIYAIDI